MASSKLLLTLLCFIMLLAAAPQPSGTPGDLMEQARMLREQAASAAAARRNGEQQPTRTAAETPTVSKPKPPIRRNLGANDPDAEPTPEPTPPPESCDDGELNNEESDIDCGGRICRSTAYLRKGRRYLHMCKHAQKCKTHDDCLSGVCDSSSDYTCSPRPAFGLVADETLLNNLHSAYFDLASDKSDGVLRTADAVGLYRATLNPDGQEVPEALEAAFTTRVEAHKEEQGLVDDATVLRWGFVSRGHCLKFVRTLNKELSLFKSEL